MVQHVNLFCMHRGNCTTSRCGCDSSRLFIHPSFDIDIIRMSRRCSSLLICRRFGVFFSWDSTEIFLCGMIERVSDHSVVKFRLRRPARTQKSFDESVLNGFNFAIQDIKDILFCSYCSKSWCEVPMLYLFREVIWNQRTLINRLGILLCR